MKHRVVMSKDWNANLLDVLLGAGLLMLMLVMAHQHHLVFTQGEYAAGSALLRFCLT